MNIRTSKPVAWIALIIVVAILILTFSMRPYWWCFIDIFFAFMAVFCHLLALNIHKMSPEASRKLDKAALFFAVLMLISLLVEWLALV